MPRKTAAVLDPPEMTQAELEEEHLKRVKTIEKAEPSRKGRVRGATNVPAGDAPSGDIIEVVRDSIALNADALEWNRGEESNLLDGDNWARIVVGAIRYGIPYDEYGGEGWHIRDDDSLGDAPLCAECREEEDNDDA